MPSPFSTFRDWLSMFESDAHVMRRVEAEKKIRLAEMEKDPRLAEFVRRIRKGEYWYDADIAFNIDPNATHVCVHLQPTEKLMRQQGIVMRLGVPLRSSAECLVNVEAFGRAIENPQEVSYREMEFKDRSLLDPDIAVIDCNTCASSLQVVHADSAKTDTPWFPRAEH